MSILSTIKKDIDDYYGNVKAYNNGFEKFFKQYAGLILGIFSILISWEISAVVGAILAIFSLYICKFLPNGILRNAGRASCCVAILLFVLWLYLG